MYVCMYGEALLDSIRALILYISIWIFVFSGPKSYRDFREGPWLGNETERKRPLLVFGSVSS